MAGEKIKKGEWTNQYSSSSFLSPAVNMVVWEDRIPCPNGHRDKTILRRKGLLVHWKCNICGRMWWTEGFKYPKDTAKKWR